jgi:hypothetical protein
MTIMITVVLSVALMAAFLVATAETSTNVAYRGQSRAFMVAQMGLERFLESPDSLSQCPTCDTLRTTPPVDVFARSQDGDSVYITVTRVRHQSGPAVPAVYFIEARGVEKGSRLSGRLAGVSGERTVGTYAQWDVNVLQVLGAWTSLTGLKKNGSAGLVSGVDQCGKAPSVAGAVVGTGDLRYNGNANWLDGSPPADTSKTAEQLAADMKIDWDGIVNRNAMPADYAIPGQAFPSLGWFDADTSRWPVIHIKGNYSLPNRGRGVLIIEGDFTIAGSDMWDGVILVGGRLFSNGNNTVAGATISGLNALLPGVPEPSESEFDDSQANGNKTYVYNWCKVTRATKSLQHYRVMPNTWVDNLPTW